MAGLMDMFRSRAQQQLINPTNPNPGTEVQNPLVPNQANPIAQPQGDKSTLDKFEKLWEVDATKQPTPAPSMVPALSLDLGKLRESASKVDFVSQIPADLITKAMSGDAAAFGQVINNAVQMGFAQSLAGAAEITKQSLTSAQTSLNTQILPAAIRQQQINDAILEANPAFGDPSVSPLLESLKTQFASKYPTAAPSEIASMAKEYLGQVAGKITGIDRVNPNSQGRPSSRMARAETDWDKFFDDVTT